MSLFINQAHQAKRSSLHTGSVKVTEKLDCFPSDARGENPKPNIHELRLPPKSVDVTKASQSKEGCEKKEDNLKIILFEATNKNQYNAQGLFDNIKSHFKDGKLSKEEMKTVCLGIVNAKNSYCTMPVLKIDKFRPERLYSFLASMQNIRNEAIEFLPNQTNITKRSAYMSLPTPLAPPPTPSQAPSPLVADMYLVRPTAHGKVDIFSTYESSPNLASTHKKKDSSFYDAKYEDPNPPQPLPVGALSREGEALPTHEETAQETEFPFMYNRCEQLKSYIAPLLFTALGIYIGKSY